MIRKWCMLIVVLLTGVAPAAAQDRLVFDGCVDAHGRAVRSIADPQLERAFDTRLEDGVAVIRYNSAVLPELPDHVRLFFYAHECARLELGLTPAAPRTVGDAWRADCRALDAIVSSQLMAPQYVARLQQDLLLGEGEWAQLPGPPRQIDLAACARTGETRGVHIPPHATPERERWNACVQKCGDTLLQCQRRTCRSLDCPACMPAYQNCVAACGVAQ